MPSAEALNVAHHLALGVVSLSTGRKQELGQRIAEALGFEPGPRGPDGGVDGALRTEDGRLAHFSSKLSAGTLDVNQAKLLYADILWHRASVSVIVAGAGYKGTFTAWLREAPYLDDVPVHALTLVDVLARTESFEAARADLPLLERLAEIDWASFRTPPR